MSGATPIMEVIPVPRIRAQQRIAVSGVAAQVALATHILGKGWIRCKARNVGVQFYFGVVADVIALDSVVANTTGWNLDSGQCEDFYLYGNSKYTHVIVIATGAGFLDIMRAGNEGVGKDVTA